VWRPGRNPVRYTSLAQLGIKPAELKFEPGHVRSHDHIRIAHCCTVRHRYGPVMIGAVSASVTE
jgi:hypothetical protein